MTRYAVHNDRQELICCWEAGYGETARTVASLPATATLLQRLVLAEALSRLSRHLWRCYTHPASALSSTAPNTEGWRRQQTRDSFSLVPKAIREPNLPDDGGTLIVSYDLVEESAHLVGRALCDIDDTDLTRAVIADVEAELTAVEQAECGDVSGRAQQAVTMTREDVSPAQVAAADRLLDEHTLGTDDLFLHFDPTAAAVAAAHWLAAAAATVGDLADIPAIATVRAADNIEALPHTTPTAVLEMIDDGWTPANVVLSLVQEAMVIADGELPLDSAAAYAVIEADADSRTPGRPPAPSTIRLTPLDPRRPARDLLEDLLAGIRGCWLLYNKYYESDAAEGADHVTADIGTAFRQAVRAQARAHQNRLA
ncbi:hypothetical protein [Dactylosporangium sp. NPDC050588]|uniref:hypothetical protein n=1 Tax=Dactylosporangium sp. NPDC050588 TaxID=3157211 RepID=UPI00340153DC